MIIKASWLSFADEDGFKGVIVTPGWNYREAIRHTHRLGINPGGEVRIYEVFVDDETFPLDKLITDRSEVDWLGQGAFPSDYGRR